MRCMLIVIGLVFLLASVASAEKVPSDVMNGPSVSAGSCDIGSYKAYTADIPAPIPIPDDDTDGVLIGPIPTGPPGSGFLDVAVEVDMAHTWAGDLRVQLKYMVDCEHPDVGAGIGLRLICRPGMDCGIPGCCGCDTDLDGTYLFHDTGADPWAAGCPTSLAPGCYAAYSSLSVLHGFQKGGCFWLEAYDHGGGDVGEIRAVTFYTLNDPGVPTESVSWGTVKHRF